MEYATLLLTVIVPLIVGYFYGGHNIDPNSEEGKLYYANGEL